MIEATINENAARQLNPNVPYSPQGITDDATATSRAGAASIQFCDPVAGSWVQVVPYYAETYRRTRAVCDPFLWPRVPFDGSLLRGSATAEPLTVSGRRSNQQSVNDKLLDNRLLRERSITQRDYEIRQGGLGNG